MTDISKKKSTVSIRLKGMANDNVDIEIPRQITGYQLFREGDDYVVFNDDPKLNEPPPKFLQLGIPVQIEHLEAASKITHELASAPIIPKEIQLPKEVGIIGDLGYYSRLDTAVRPFFFQPSQLLGIALEKNVFPFAKESGARIARTSIVNIKEFYSRVAITKLGFLSGKLGMSGAEDLGIEKRRFEAVLPSPFEPQELLNALLILPPYVFGITLPRPNASLILVPEKVKIFDYRLFRTLPDYLIPDLGHLQAKGQRAVLETRNIIDLPNQFVDVISNAVNTFWDYFTNPLIWTDENGTFDELRALKGMSLARFLIADLSGIQRTSMSFARHRLMFEFFDKLAQLCVESANIKKNRNNIEAKWASHMLHPDMLDLIYRVFRYHSKTKRKKVFSTLFNFASAVKKSIENDLDKMHKEAGLKTTPSSIADSIRLIRNLAHGTFLSGGRFETQLLRINPTVPIDAQRLPWLYLVALALDPKYFLSQAIQTLPKE